jgi:Tfp pilus assembly protein PilN
VFLVPTVTLATLLLVLAVVLGAQGTYEQRRQLSLLRGEIARYEPVAKKAEGLAKAAERARSRARVLDTFQRRTSANLDALGEITGLLAPPAWLNGLEIDGNTITITGQIDQAAPLLKLLDSSPFFRNSEFVGQIGKAGPNEVFRIRTTREEALP